MPLEPRSAEDAVAEDSAEIDRAVDVVALVRLVALTFGRSACETSFLIEPRLETPESRGDGPQVTESTVREYARRLDIHLRGNLPCWQHLQEEDALRRMENLLDGSLADRYKL